MDFFLAAPLFPICRKIILSHRKHFQERPCWPKQLQERLEFPSSLLLGTLKTCISSSMLCCHGCTSCKPSYFLTDQSLWRCLWGLVQAVSGMDKFFCVLNLENSNSLPLKHTNMNDEQLMNCSSNIIGESCCYPPP